MDRKIFSVLRISTGFTACQIGFFLHINSEGGHHQATTSLNDHSQSTHFKIQFVCLELIRSIADYFIKQNEKREQTHLE